MKFSKKYLEKVEKIIKPIDHFETLAKDGFLNEYLNSFFYDKYVSDLRFREEMMLLQLQYSEEPIEEINEDYLIALSDELANFIKINDR